MTKEVFVDEWIYRPQKKRGEGVHRIYITTAVPLEPFQLYVLKIYKIVVSKDDDYHDFMNVMRNVRPADKKLIMNYMRKFLPGQNKIKNIGEEISPGEK